MLSPEREEEVAALAARYGTPRRIAVELSGQPFTPVSSRNRSGEVCMVVRRKDGTLITAIKTFYPPGAFRLLTGGIEHGEAVEAALLRETQEETNLDVVVRRFLAVIEYELNVSSEQTYRFVTFALLLDEVGGTLQSMDPHEQLAEFRMVAVADLPALADTLAQVGDGFDEEIAGKWGDWGRFRAVVHRAVYDALTE